MTNHTSANPSNAEMSTVIGGMPWDWDLISGDLKHFGIAALALWINPSLDHLLGPLRTEIGADLYRLLVARCGSQGTAEDYEVICSPDNASFEDGFAAWSRAVSSAGWGRFTLQDFDQDANTATVRVDNPWEARLTYGASAVSCPFLQGKMIGIFSHVFGVNCWADEKIVRSATISYVQFTVYPSNKTIDREIDALRQNRMREDQRALAIEVENKTGALIETQADQHAILSSLSDLIVTVDGQDIIQQYIVPMAGEDSFPSNHEVRGQTISQVFGDAYRNILELVKSHQIKPLELYSELVVAGVVRSYDARASLRCSTKGIVDGVTVVIRDTTVQRQLEHELRTRKSMETVGQLATGIAHDFNNLLQSTVGSAELLRLRVPEQDHPLVDVIIHNSATAASLIRRMSHFTNTGRSVVGPIKIHEVIAHTVEMLRHSMDARFRIHTALHAHEPVVAGHMGQAENLLLNLGINARDAMPDGGEIQITTRTVTVDEDQVFPTLIGTLLTGRSYVQISVRDDGQGIEQEAMAKIFAPFYTTKADGSGTGLGLMGVESAVLEHSGALNVVSNLGKGSTFIVYLPIASAQEPANTLPTNTQNPTRTKRSGCILLVDDNPFFQTIGEQLLMQLGYDVLIAADGIAAVSCLKENFDTVDAVVLDTMMPTMDGVQAVMHLREVRPDIPVLLSSGLASDLVQAPPGVPVIRKPFGLDTLERELNILLGHS